MKDHKMNIYSYYKYLSVILVVLAMGIFTLESFGIGHDFFTGLASSFLLCGLILSSVLFLKRKNKLFRSDLNSMGTDERLKQMSHKRQSTMNYFLLGQVVLMVVVSVYYEFSFHIGGTIILWTQLIGGLVLWLKDRRA